MKRTYSFETPVIGGGWKQERGADAEGWLTIQPGMDIVNILVPVEWTNGKQIPKSVKLTIEAID